MYGSGMMTFTGQRNNTPPRKTVGFPNPCDNFFKLPLQARCVCSERCSWFDGCTFAKKFGFFEIPRRYCHTDSQAAGAAVSITSMQNWPHGQIRFCYAKSVGERQVNSCSNPGKPLGFPKTCDNFFKLPLQAGFVCSERCSRLWGEASRWKRWGAFLCARVWG